MAMGANRRWRTHGSARLALGLLVVVLAAAGCARTTPLPGLRLDEQGRVVRMDAAGARLRAEHRVLAALEARWPQRRFAVGISPDPYEDRDYDDERGWRWRRITVSVLAPEGTSADEIGAVVGKQLVDQLVQPELLKVQVARPAAEPHSQTP